MMDLLMELRVRRVLKGTFGLDSLRPGQKKAVEALLTGHDLICVMPTGGGKSLCYQLPALLMDGPALVISPLISLMQDQTDHLREKGIPAALLTSRQGVVQQQDNLTAMQEGRARLIYAAPQRLSQPRFLDALQAYPPALVVVDEAHCVVEWGREFRPEYGQIGDFIRTLPRRPLICAFTATADKDTRQEIAEVLGLDSPVTVRQPLQRPNLRYQVFFTGEPEAEMIQCVRSRPDERGIVFCRTRAETERMAGVLQQAGVAAECYHARQSPETRLHTQERFASGHIPVLTATSAFGMGVDLPDIRYVIHLGMCTSSMDYVQQSGRAGRDGQPADCIQLISPADLNWHRRRLQADHDPQAWQAMEQLLHVFLSGRCIQQGLARCFEDKGRLCGCCSACVRRREGHHRALAAVPQLQRMTKQDLLYWSLDTQRSMLAEERHTSPGKILSNHLLDLAADTGRLEPGVLDQEAWERFLAVMQM